MKQPGWQSLSEADASQVPYPSWRPGRNERAAQARVQVDPKDEGPALPWIVKDKCQKQSSEVAESEAANPWLAWATMGCEAARRCEPHSLVSGRAFGSPAKKATTRSEPAAGRAPGSPASSLPAEQRQRREVPLAPPGASAAHSAAATSS